MTALAPAFNLAPPVFAIGAISLSLPLVIYAILGPALWGLFLLATAMAYTRMSRFRRPRVALPEPPPRVTILVPAKDEGDGIRGCLERVLAQDYPNFSVLAINDRSADATGRIMDELAGAHPEKLRALHVPMDGLPAGWLGKCNALHVGVAHARGRPADGSDAARSDRETGQPERSHPAGSDGNGNGDSDSDGDWLLFVDSDVKVEPDALGTALALAAERKYDALSIMTRLETHSFWERLILPLAAASVGAITLMSLTNNDRYTNTAFANGQFFLIRRSAYEKVGGHEAVRDNITEDVALMRLLKGAGHRVRLYYGRDFASTRMHTTLQSMFNGWARIYSGVTNRNPLRILLAMLVVLSGLASYVSLVASLAALASTGRTSWLIASLAHVALMTIVLAVIYHMSGNPKRYALLFPLGGAVMLAIYAGAIRACRTGRIAWRGTNYTKGSATHA